MSGVIRIFVEKRDGFNVLAKQTLWDIRHNLGMRNVTDLRYIMRYDIEGLSLDEYNAAKGTILSEPNADVIYEETLPVEDGWKVFAMEYLPGQYDQRGDSAEQCVQLLTQGERCKVLTARVVAVTGDISDYEDKLVQNHFIRISRNCIVNMKFIHSFFEREIRMTTGKRVEMSRRKITEVKEVFTKYLVLGGNHK